MMDAFKYDVMTDTWTSIHSLNQARYIENAVRLSESEILITGLYKLMAVK